MTDFYALLPIIPVVAIVATYSYSIMTESAKKMRRLPLGWFTTVSAGAYWYFFTNTNGGSGSDAFAVLYTVYVVAFLFPLLLLGRLRSPVYSAPYALIGAAVAMAAAIGSFIVLFLLYFLTGIFKDS